ncbi:hypothetical protein [Sphingobacterium lactis]|nr:hypothetical protein [Sphingobacterium lactis]
MDAIRSKFIENTLRDEGNRFIRNQGIAIKNALKSRTGNLIRNRKATVTGTGSNAQLHIEVPAYTRFLDIRNKFKRSRRGQSKRSSGRGLQIYNRFVMGHYYGLAERLQFGYTQETIDMIRSKWEGGFNG